MTPAIRSELILLTQNMDTAANPSRLLDFLQSHQTPQHSTHLNNLLHFLNHPPSSPSPLQLSNLLEQAEMDSSSEQIRSLLTLFSGLLTQGNNSSSVYPHTDLCDLIKYLTPSQHASLLDQTNTILSLLQYHFTDKPHLINRLANRLWDLSIIDSLIPTPPTSISNPSSSSTTRKTPFHTRFSYFHQKLSPATSINPLHRQQLETWIHTVSQNPTSPSQLSSIEELFDKLRKPHESTSNQHASKLLNVLQKIPRQQLRSILLQENHLQVILSLPTTLQLQFLA